MSETYIDQGLVYTLNTTNNIATLTGTDDTTDSATILSSFTKDGVDYTVELTGGAFNGNTILEELIVPSNFTELPSNFCSSFPGLKSITLEGNDIVIRSQAFKNCGGLNNFNFHNVKSLDYASLYGTPLLDVDLGSNIESVGGSAFMHSGLTSIIFSSHPNFTTIPGSCCKTCRSITSVTIPANVKIIGGGAFWQNGSLSTVTFLPNSQLEEIDGSAFGRSGLTTFTIPASVTTFGSKIWENTAMTSIIFEHTVPFDIGTFDPNILFGVPSDCNITFNSIVYPTISDFLEGINVIHVHEGLEYRLFSGNRAVLTGHNNITTSATILPHFTKDEVQYNVELTGGAFNGNTTLETLTVPSNFTELPSNFCVSFSGLKSITLLGTDIVIGESAFEGCGLLNNFNFNNVKSLAYASFYGISIDNVDLGSNIESVGGSAFMASGIKSIIFSSHPNFTTIPGSCCNTVRSITSVTIPANVKIIGAQAFFDCDSLTTVTFLPNSQLEQIDGSAFARSGGLTTFTIPASVTTIGGDIFKATGSLQEIIFEHETIPAAGIHANAFRGVPDTCVIKHGEILYNTVNEFFNSLRFTYEGFQYQFNSDNTATLVGHDGSTNPAKMVPSFIEGGVTYTVVFEGGHFSGNNTLQSVEILTGVSQIVNSMFSQCNSLQSVTINASNVSIGDRAFYSCSNLLDLSFDNVDSIASYAFNYCGIQHADLSNVSVINANAFRVSSLQSITFSSKQNTIPNNVCDNCGNLRSVTIPSNVTTINQNAFTTCRLLETVTILSPSDLTHIHYQAFYQSGIRTINIPDTITYMDPTAILRCSNLESITLPPNITTLPNFRDFTNLHTVNIRVPVIIEAYGFQNTKLKNFQFNLVKKVGHYAFRNCNELTEAHFSDTLESSGYYIFTNCAALKHVTLGKIVENTKQYFGNCPQLKSVTILENGPELKEQMFKNSNLEMLIFKGPSLPTFESTFMDDSLVSVSNVAVRAPEILETDPLISAVTTLVNNGFSVSNINSNKVTYTLELRF